MALALSMFWVAVAVALSRLVYYLLGLRFVVITFGKSWGPIIAAHATEVLVSLVGLAVALAGISLMHLTSPWVRELTLVAFYVLASGILLIAGPKWLVAPAAPVFAALVGGHAATIGAQDMNMPKERRPQHTRIVKI